MRLPKKRCDQRSRVARASSWLAAAVVATSTAATVHAQSVAPVARPSARASITQADLRRHIEFLASDTLEGRRGGTDGARAAAAYIADQFRSYGLSPQGEGFRQEFGDKGLQNVVARWGKPESALAPIIVSAHYDHVGTGGRGTKKENNGQIHNGADDNASGTALVLEVAQACSMLPPPERPVLFALWDGEEQGLIGSGDFAKSHEESQDLPALAFVCDMIGRSSCDRLYIYGIDTVEGLENLLDTSVSQLLPKNIVEPVYIRKHLPRSDHWPFYKRNVPYLLFHTGLHDQYHRPTDDADLVNYEAAESISRLAFEVLQVVTNGEFPLELSAASLDLPKTNLPPRSTCNPDEAFKSPQKESPKATDEVSGQKTDPVQD